MKKEKKNNAEKTIKQVIKERRELLKIKKSAEIRVREAWRSQNITDLDREVERGLRYYCHEYNRFAHNYAKMRVIGILYIVSLLINLFFSDFVGTIINNIKDSFTEDGLVYIFLLLIAFIGWAKFYIPLLLIKIAELIFNNGSAILSNLPEIMSIGTEKFANISDLGPVIIEAIAVNYSIASFWLIITLIIRNNEYHDRSLKEKLKDSFYTFLTRWVCSIVAGFIPIWWIVTGCQFIAGAFCTLILLVNMQEENTIYKKYDSDLFYMEKAWEELENYREDGYIKAKKVIDEHHDEVLKYLIADHCKKKSRL